MGSSCPSTSVGRSHSSRTLAAGGSPKGKPARQRATYHRNGGTRKLLGAYDVGADRLWGHVEKRRVTGEVVLEFLKDIRRRYPAETTVYIVMDNLSAHWTPDIRR